MRILAGQFVGAWLMSLALTAGAMCALLLLQRLLAFEVNWQVAWLGAIAASIGGAMAWTLIRRPDWAEVARAVDDHAQLRETISTALHVRGANDPWSVATLENASNASRRVIVRQAFPVTPPRRWKLPLIAIATFALLALILPQWDLLGAIAEREEAERAREELIETVALVKAEEEQLSKLVEQTGDDGAKDRLDDAEETPEPRTADEVKRGAIKKLTSVKERLEELRQGAEGQSLDAMRRKMQDLRQPGAGPLNELVDALQRGDFAGAFAKLDDLQNRIASGEMSDAEKQRLAEQLQQLAQQLEEISKARSELAQQLQALGLDGALANNPEALQQALEQMQGLTDEQKQQLMQMAEGLQQCENQLGQMAQQMAEAGGQMMEGMDPGALGALGEMLGEMEMLEAEMAACDAGIGQCNAGLARLGQGMGTSPSIFTVPKKGQGQGNRGLASGAPGEIEEAPFKTNKERTSGRTQEGPIIGVRLVQEGQVVGESRAEYTDVVRAADEVAREAIEDNVIPREYHDAVKRYFGKLQSKVETEKAGEPDDDTESETQEKK